MPLLEGLQLEEKEEWGEGVGEGVREEAEEAEEGGDIVSCQTRLSYITSKIRIKRKGNTVHRVKYIISMGCQLWLLLQFTLKNKIPLHKYSLHKPVTKYLHP